MPVEHAHMNHPDFRVGKKIFATLGYPDGKSGMVRLNSEQQELLLSTKPGIFTPASGAWGKRGSTLINLQKINVPLLALDLSATSSLSLLARIVAVWINARPPPAQRPDRRTP
jgi:hypothetical protein